jgi:CRISPR-associated protein Csm1
MDTPLNWNEEFPLVEKLKNKLVRLIKENVLPNSFLSKIMAHTANADIKEHKITKVKTFWILTYDLSRMKERYKQTEGQRIINNCITEVCGNKSQLNGISIETTYHPLELWTFAARWAELETRINK